MRKGKPSKGFTLIELMVVVLIMGIIFALVAYSVSRMLPNMQIATASQQLLGAVGKARMLAVTKSSIVELQLKSMGGASQLDSIIILIKNPYDTLVAGGTWATVSTTTLSQGVKFMATAKYDFWRDGSLDVWPATDPVIQCINRQTTQESLSVMSATGIAEMKH